MSFGHGLYFQGLQTGGLFISKGETAVQKQVRGDAPATTEHAPTKLRLFVSPVKPSVTQVGELVVP